MTKLSFQQEKLAKNIFGLATTGFNLDRSALIDRSKVASSSKYGKTDIQRPHPGWNVVFYLFRQNGVLQLMKISKIPSNCSTQPITPLKKISKQTNQKQREAALLQIILTWMVKDGTQIQCWRATTSAPSIVTDWTPIIPSIVTLTLQKCPNCLIRSTITGSTEMIRLSLNNLNLFYHPA